jgi:hypothetical protein
VPATTRIDDGDPQIFADQETRRGRKKSPPPKRCFRGGPIEIRLAPGGFALGGALAAGLCTFLAAGLVGLVAHGGAVGAHFFADDAHIEGYRRARLAEDGAGHAQMVARLAVLGALGIVFLATLDAVLTHVGAGPTGFGARVGNFSGGLSRTAYEGQSDDARECGQQGSTICSIHHTKLHWKEDAAKSAAVHLHDRGWKRASQISQRQSRD